MKRILLSILVIGVLLLSACGAPTTAPAPAPAPAPASQPVTVEPELLKEWQGSGIKTTEQFSINQKPWVIGWSNNPTIMGGQSVGMLQIMVYDIKNPNIPITLAANTSERATDNTFIYQTGTFYLTINAANTDWIVQVWAVE